MQKDNFDARRSSGGPKASLWSQMVIGLVLMALIGGAIYLWQKQQAAAADKLKAAGRTGFPPVPVIVGKVMQRDVPIYLDGIGTVQAFNTVTVHVRVDGQIQKVAFVEGQDVKQGDVLALIDPAPFKAQLDQNKAKKLQDEAMLATARLDLKREEQLYAAKIDSQQLYDTQLNLVHQMEATVHADQAAIDSAQVQLDYTTVTAPIDGRTGMRQVDTGNIVHATDATGLVVIAQLKPISVVFTLPAQNLGVIQQEMLNEVPKVLAIDADNAGTLAEGKLAVIDNQIDTTTATIKIKATFANEKLQLWPGQFVNSRLLLKTRKGGLVVPATVVQRGPDGSYAFVVTGEGEDAKVKITPIKVAQISGNEALIDAGLAAGDVVVVDGQYKLQNGSKVRPAVAGGDAGAGGGRGTGGGGTNSGGRGAGEAKEGRGAGANAPAGAGGGHGPGNGRAGTEGTRGAKPAGGTDKQP